MDRAIWRRLVGTAIRVPSPGNVQPWWIAARDERTADLFIDGDRVLPMEDPTGSFLLASMAMFVEGLRIAGRACGMTLSCRLRGDPELIAERMHERTGRLIPFACLTLENDPAPCPDYPPRLLERRRTSRLAYAPEPVERRRVRAAVAVARAYGIGYGQIDDAARIARVIDLHLATLVAELNDAAVHDEIVPWLRSGDRESARRGDGLSSRCMNVSSVEISAARSCPSLFRTPVLSAVLRARYQTKLSCGTIGYLHGPFMRPADAVRCGPGLLRFWLELTAAGLSLHPLGNLVTSPSAMEACADELGVRDAWFIFRLGDSACAPCSERRLVEEILRS